MTILIDLYHLSGILVGVIAVIGIIIKMLHTKFKEAWNNDIKVAKEKLEEQFKCSDSDCKSRIKEVSGNKFEIVSKDMGTIQDAIAELKTILKTQQETLIAIQVGVADLKPRIESLEKRVDNIEQRI